MVEKEKNDNILTAKIYFSAQCHIIKVRNSNFEQIKTQMHKEYSENQMHMEQLKLLPIELLPF